jgi:hypothetical protein
MNNYAIGSTVRFSVAFTTVGGGVAYDPALVSLQVRDPVGDTKTYTYALGEITKSGTGAYYKDIDMSLAGQWVYYWLGDDTQNAADNNSVYVTGKFEV